MLHPVNVAKPLLLRIEFPPVQLRTPPPGLLLMLSVIVAVSLATTLPPPSSIATVGLVGKTWPVPALDGDCVKTSCVAVPLPTRNEPRVTGVSDETGLELRDVAVSVSVPAWLMLQPVKVATPPELDIVLPPVQVSVPGPVAVRRMLAVSEVTTSPCESSMATVGLVEKT